MSTHTKKCLFYFAFLCDYHNFFFLLAIDKSYVSLYYLRGNVVKIWFPSSVGERHGRIGSGPVVRWNTESTVNIARSLVAFFFPQRCSVVVTGPPKQGYELLMFSFLRLFVFFRFLPRVLHFLLFFSFRLSSFLTFT